MRAPSSPHGRPGLPLGAAAGALALVGAAAFGLLGAGTARAQGYETIQDGAFHGPLADSWTCEGQVAVVEGGVEGRPGTHDFAGCTQQVSVRPYGTYELTATVSGAYAFVGVLGGPDTEAVYRWADGEHETRLHATIRVGAHTQILTVYFHGWYNQGPYRLDGISLYGSTDLPACPDMTGAPPSSPRLPLPSTEAAAAAAPVPSPSPSWTGMNCLPPPSAQPSSTAPPRPGTT